MIGNNAAMGMYGLSPNNLYANQIALNDLTNLDLYPPMGMTMDPLLSMNGSIFGNGYNNFGMMGMGGMPYMPTFGGGYANNYQDYYKNLEQYQDFMIDNQVRQQQKMRTADLRLNSPQEGIQKKAVLLKEKIMQDEQEQIQIAYKDFIASVKAMYPDGSDEEIANRASSIYSQLNGGTSVNDDIRQYGKGSFEQGFLQTVTLGLADKKTAEENISDLTGQPVGRTEKSKKFAGNIAGGALFGGATFLATMPLLKALKVGAKSRTFWGILAGGIVGLGTALATSK